MHVGQPLVGLMMIDDEDVCSERTRDGQRLEARRPAVDGDDERGAFLDKCLDGRRVRAIAFEQPVGDIDARREAVMGKEPRHQRRGAGAVDVVIAENGDPLALLDGIR